MNIIYIETLLSYIRNFNIYPNIKLYLIDETEYKNVISKTDYLRIYTEQIKLI